MLKRLAFSAIALLFGFSLLFISAFRTAAVKFEFTGPVQELNNKTQVLGESDNIEYIFPYPGKVLPDSIFWPLKSARDQIWLKTNTNEGKDADLLLLFADKRLLAGQILFEKGNYDVGFSTLSKAEQYLERAMNKEIENSDAGMDTADFLVRINKASLAHYGVLEELKSSAPSDALPKIVEIQNYPIMVYRTSRDALLQRGMKPVENPYDWE